MARPFTTIGLPRITMAAKTESHRKIAEKMSSARTQASFTVMSRNEFLAQTPKELRIAKAGDQKSPKPKGN